MDEDIGVISKVYFGWLNSVLNLNPEINSFEQLSDGSIVLSLVKFYDETYKLCRATNLFEVIQILKAFFVSRNIECSFDEESTDVMFMDILWTFMLYFTICPGDEVKPEDKCIELGRCLLMEWLQIVCPSSCNMDADEELSKYFNGNRYIIDIIESVFSTNLTLPSGSLQKEIFCALVLVEEAFGIRKDIIEVKLLIDGDCPEFALITYLSLLKAKYMDDPEQSHGKVTDVVNEIIAEQPSKECLEFDEECHIPEKRLTTSNAVMSNGSEVKELGYPLSGSVISISTPESGFYSCSTASHEVALGRTGLDGSETFMASTPRNDRINKERLLIPTSCVGGKTWEDFLQGKFDETSENMNNKDAALCSSRLDNVSNVMTTHDNGKQITNGEEIVVCNEKMNDTVNTTDVQVTVIKQNENTAPNQVNKSIAESKADRALVLPEVLLVPADEMVASQLTPSLYTNSDNRNNSDDDSSFCNTPVLAGDKSTPQVSQSPEDPLMKLLDNIASKGCTLKEALDQSLLNETLHAETKTYDFDEKVRLMQRVTELETKNLELTLTIENLSASLNDNESRLARESQKVMRISKESDRLLDVNRSFREENLKMEEKIIHLENVGMRKDTELAQLKSELKAKIEECENKMLVVTNAEPCFVDVDEKEAVIIGMQHELEDILFEKSKLSQELDHLRDLIKQRDSSHDDVAGKPCRQKLDPQLEYDTQSKIAELNETVCKLEKSLLESHQRNEMLNEKLDFMNFSANSHYHLTPNYGCFHMENHGLTQRNSALNRSFPGIAISNHRASLGKPSTNLSCYFNVKSDASETPRENNLSNFQYFDRSIYESTQPSISKADRLNISSDEFLLCPATPYSQQPNRLPSKMICNCGVQSHTLRPLVDVHRNYEERFSCSCQSRNSQVLKVLSESQCDKPCCRNEYAVEDATADYPNSRGTGFEVPDAVGAISREKQQSPPQLFMEQPQSPETVGNAHIESKSEPATNLVSQSTRILIDKILAKYSSQGIPNQEHLLPSDSNGNTATHIEKTMNVTPSSEINSAGYQSLRQATQKLRDQLTGSEPAEVEEKSNGDLPVTVKSFDEYLQSPSNGVTFDRVVRNTCDDLKPFLSRSLASAGVFLYDGNTDLQNKSMLSSVRSIDRESTAPKNSKFSALFSGMDYDHLQPPSYTQTSYLLQETNGTYETSSKVAEIGQRLKEGLKRSEFGCGDNQLSQASKTESVPEQTNISGNRNNGLVMPSFQRNGLINIEDEVLSRYKRELRLIEDPKDEKVNSVIPSFQDSFVENIGAIRDQSAVYKSKIQPPKDLLFPQDSEKAASQFHSEPFRPSPFADDANETVIPQRNDSNLIKGYLNKLDQKYGKPQSRQNQAQDQIEESSHQNIVRSSTPTKQIVTKKEVNSAPNFDVSHISTASNSVNRNANSSVSVQFYDEAALPNNVKAGPYPMQTTPTNANNGLYSSASGKFINPTVLFT